MTSMNDRKRAWQILHTEIRRRADDRDTNEANIKQFGAIMREVQSPVAVIIELAGFGATFAQMVHPADPERVKGVADAIGIAVMQEPDEEEEE